MEIDALLILKKSIYEKLENYVKDNGTGLAYIYLIMSNETKDLLCGEGENLFYGGLKTAVDNTIDFGKVVIK